MTPRISLGVGAAICFLLLPLIAHACPVCGVGRDEANRTAFIVTTGFMTALPLAMLGAAVWWLRRRVRQIEEGTE